MSDLKTLEEKYKALGEEIERLKNKPTERFWNPSRGDTYLYLTGGYKATQGNNDTFIDRLRIDGANCYRLEEKELAEKDATKAKARQIIQRTADQLHGYRYEFIEEGYNYFVYKCRGNLLIAEVKHSYNAITFFSTRAIAEQCLRLCREEYKILLGVG